ncbi:MAG: hypothetical protein ACLQVL_03885 [Terriglobia bacterium]
MSDRRLMRREETRFLKAAQRVLLQGGFPNPERTGCPEESILKAMASREVSPDKVMDWIEHVGMCSPCFREYTELRQRVVWRRRAAYLSMAAAVIIVILSLGWWRWRSGQATLITGRFQIVADMRNRLMLRGEQGPGNRPLVFQRGYDDVSFYLPEGSKAGNYDVAIFHQEPTEPLASTTGAAKMEYDKTIIKVTLDLSRIAPGDFLVGIRLPGTDWSYYPVVLK